MFRCEYCMSLNKRISSDTRAKLILQTALNYLPLLMQYLMLILKAL